MNLRMKNKTNYITLPRCDLLCTINTITVRHANRAENMAGFLTFIYLNKYPAFVVNN